MISLTEKLLMFISFILIFVIIPIVIMLVFARFDKPYSECKKMALLKSYPEYELNNNTCYGINSMESVILYQNNKGN